MLFVQKQRLSGHPLRKSDSNDNYSLITQMISGTYYILKRVLVLSIVFVEMLRCCPVATLRVCATVDQVQRIIVE